MKECAYSRNEKNMLLLLLFVVDHGYANTFRVN